MVVTVSTVVSGASVPTTSGSATHVIRSCADGTAADICSTVPPVPK